MNPTGLPTAEHIKAKKELRDIGLKTGKYILNWCNKYYGFDVTTPKRYRFLVDARFMTMKMIRDYTNLTLDDVGGFFNKRHDMVIHAIKEIENRIELEGKTRNDYEYINTQLSKRYKKFDKAQDMLKNATISDIISHLEDLSVEEVILLKSKICLTRSEMML